MTENSTLVGPRRGPEASRTAALADGDPSGLKNVAGEAISVRKTPPSGECKINPNLTRDC